MINHVSRRGATDHLVTGSDREGALSDLEQTPFSAAFDVYVIALSVITILVMGKCSLIQLGDMEDLIL